LKPEFPDVCKSPGAWHASAFEGVTSEFCKQAAAVQWVPNDFADSILYTLTRGVFPLML